MFTFLPFSINLQRYHHQSVKPTKRKKYLKVCPPWYGFKKSLISRTSKTPFSSLWKYIIFKKITLDWKTQVVNDLFPSKKTLSCKNSTGGDTLFTWSSLMTSNEVMKKCLPSRNQKTVRKLEHMLKANLISLSNTLTPGKAQCYLEQALVSQLSLQLVDLS